MLDRSLLASTDLRSGAKKLEGIVIREYVEAAGSSARSKAQQLPQDAGSVLITNALASRQEYYEIITLNSNRDLVYAETHRYLSGDVTPDEVRGSQPAAQGQ
ncbi:unnamed protein product, partial [Iphiclides podalirius]